MKYLLVVFSIFSISAAFGQNSISIKAYQNTDYFTSKYYNSYSKQLTTYKYCNIKRLSFAINIARTKNLSHELELFVPEILKSSYKVQFPLEYNFREQSYIKNRISTYALRYQFTKLASFPSDWLNFGIGVGINLYYIRNEYKPQHLWAFFVRENFYCISLNVTPIANFTITNRLSLNLSIPIKAYDLKREYLYRADPNKPIAQQREKPVMHHNFFEEAYTFRFGINYLIVK